MCPQKNPLCIIFWGILFSETNENYSKMYFINASVHVCCVILYLPQLLRMTRIWYSCVVTCLHTVNAMTRAMQMCLQKWFRNKSAVNQTCMQVCQELNWFHCCKHEQTAPIRGGDVCYASSSDSAGFSFKNWYRRWHLVKDTMCAIILKIHCLLQIQFLGFVCLFVVFTAYIACPDFKRDTSVRTFTLWLWSRYHIHPTHFWRAKTQQQWGCKSWQFI